MPVALPEPDGEREGIPLWPSPIVPSTSLWKTTGGRSEMIFAPVSKSGSSKVGAIGALRHWLRAVR